jgi:hypothetical protein
VTDGTSNAGVIAIEPEPLEDIRVFLGDHEGDDGEQEECGEHFENPIPV